MELTRFDVIGNSYETALAKYPHCRSDHLWLLHHANLSPNTRVLEISGGTGFLTKKILDIVTTGKVTVQDIAPAALSLNKEKLGHRKNIDYLVESDMGFPNLSNEEFDSIIGLGGFHHIEDQVTFCRAMYRALKPNGVLCLGDFEDNSSMQRYFDERIDSITPTGHQGLFASRSRFINLGRFAGFDHTLVERKKVPFCFANEMEVGEFFQMVHALNQSPAETLLDVKNFLDIAESDAGLMVILEYIYVCYQKGPL